MEWMDIFLAHSFHHQDRENENYSYAKTLNLPWVDGINFLY